MRLAAIAIVAASLSIPASHAQEPIRTIEAQAGDVILVKDRAAVRVVRRIDANVRVINNAAERWVVVLVDEDASGSPADGRVDVSYTFNDVDGNWPLGDRWEGRATVDAYSIAGDTGSVGLGLHTSSGLVQILNGPRGPRMPRVDFRDAAAAATLTFSGFGRGGGGSQSFDAAERQQTAVAARNAAGMRPGAPFSSSLDFRIDGVTSSPPDARQYPAPAAPVRVGGNIRTPVRIENAEPVLPEVARQAGVRGVVILEITIGRDGRVTDAKVLRSIPLLDAAAIDAARKWRYEPTLLNGAPVPVIMTATVAFQ